MKRSGFTLIELLVVMTIVLILFGLTFQVLRASMDNARHDATRATILTLHRAISYRAENVQRYDPRGEATFLKAQYDTGGNAAPNHVLPIEIATLLVQKNRFRAELPQRLEDLFGIDGAPGTPDDSLLWVAWKKTCNANGLAVTDANIRPTGHRLDLENCELLYLFLTKTSLFDHQPFVADRLNQRHVRETPIDIDGDGKTDLPGNGHKELVDDWGNPIRFYNWPTRLVRPGGNRQPIDQGVFGLTADQFLAIINPPESPVPFPVFDTATNQGVNFDHPLNQDPDDPLGAVSSAMDATGLLTTSFVLNRSSGPATCPPFDEAHYHTLDTYHAPLVISAGLDGVLGMVEPTEQTAPERRTGEPLDTTQLDDLFDNVTIQK